MVNLKTVVIGTAIATLAILAVILGGKLDRRVAFMPGITSSGHQLFETSCQSCHDGFKPVTNDSCNRCHEAEMAEDKHGIRKFRDMRWAAFLEEVDVLTCTTCHEEHMPMFSRGVNIPPDLCMACHDHTIAAGDPDSLASHVGFTPDGCWTAGCHNFHDHRSISTGFLTANLDQPNWLPEPKLKERAFEPKVAVAPAPDLNRVLWEE